MSVEAGDAHAVTRDATGTATRVGLLMRVITDVRLLLIALWLGAAVFFSAVVAPGVFGVLRGAAVPQANHLAGTIVTRTLGIINTGGFFIGVLLLLTAFLFKEAVKRRAFAAEIIALVVIAVTTGLGQWAIAARMSALRVRMGRPIDDVPLDDSLRATFNSLHGLSVMALSIGMIAALVALFLIARRGRENSL